MYSKHSNDGYVLEVTGTEFNELLSNDAGVCMNCGFIKLEGGKNKSCQWCSKEMVMSVYDMFHNRRIEFQHTGLQSKALDDLAEKLRIAEKKAKHHED